MVFASASGNSVYGNSQRSEPNSTILIIASYNPDTQRMSDFISEFERDMAESGDNYNIVVEDLGCKGLSDIRFWRGRMEEIFSRYDIKNLRAVILLGQEAWATFLARKKFDMETPFFGCFASTNGIIVPRTSPGTDWYPESVDMIHLADSIGVAGGSLNRYDVRKNIELILSLYPNTENIAFVSDNTYGGISMQALVRKEMENFPDLNLILVDSRQGDDQASKIIEKLDKKSVVLIGTWRVGSEGQYLLFNSMDNLTSSNPSVPVFSLSGSGLGSAAIGGYVPKYGNGVQQIAQQISDFYSGSKDSITFITTGEEYRFDRKKLKEFSISEYRLPKGSIVVDDVELQLEKYRSYIAVGSAMLIGLILVIVFMYYLYYRNKKLREVLEFSEKELIKAKDKAEESDRLKSAFLANMSHEIRTPLNAILGFSRIIAETDNSEERLQYYDIVEKNNMRLQELINEILDLSKIESGMMEFNYAPVNLYTLCDDVKNTYRFRCQSGVELIFEKSDRSLYISTDRNRLFQIFSNLIGNATKFTQKGYISFGYKKVDDQILFHVTDTGTGIPAEKLPKIFDRFIMANESIAGTGLGLSISKIIAEKLGGKIWVNSEPGKGTTFTFTIPYISVNGEVKREKHTFTRYTDNKESIQKEIVILVAEDNQSNYDLIEAMIGKTYKLVHALDGMEAIQYYEKYSPDLILMDIKMPNLDGLDATRIIREVSPEIPVIAVSAYAYEKDKAAAIESGCNEFLIKPISPDLLKDTINKYLKNT